MRSVLCLLSALLLLGVSPSFAPGQEMVQIGGPGAFGCQSSAGPTLSNGDIATGVMGFSYDATSAVLTLTIENTTPVIPGANTAVITRAYFNLPAGVTGASLLTQSQGAGARAPNFELVLGGNHVACLGTYDAQLVKVRNGIRGSIANAAATQLSGPPGSQVLGPVVFTFAITGAGTGSLTATDFAQAVTPDSGYQAGVKFQGSGPGGGPGSGFISSSPMCVGVQAEVVDLGFGCGDFMGVEPDLIVSPPVIGSPLNILLDTEFPNALFWIFVSTGRPAVSFLNAQGILVMPGDPTALCTIYVDLNDLMNLDAIEIGFTDGNGDFSTSIPLTLDPSLIGLEFTLQSRVCAPNSPIIAPAGDWFSNGVRARIGCP